MAAQIAAGPERTLMFVRTQRGADRLVKQLEREGVRAGALHGGMAQAKRERVLRDFTTGEGPVLVATNVAARGIHVDDINIVVHYDPPEEHKIYLHRSGRTARAGASGVVVTLVLPEQMDEVHDLRRQAGLNEAVVAMSPGDARLGNLADWEPPMEEHVKRPPLIRPAFNRPNRGGWREASPGRGGRENRGSHEGRESREGRPQARFASRPVRQPGLRDADFQRRAW